MTDSARLPLSPTPLAGFHYLLVPPADVPPSQPLPAVVILHYYTAHPQTLLPLFQGLPLPSHLICPQGPYPAEEGYSWFPEDFYDRDLAGQAAALRQSAAGLAAFLEELPHILRLAGSPLVTGFSQGGDLSYALALEYPHLVGMAIPMGGRLEAPFRPAPLLEAARHVPIRALHGEADPIVPIASAREGVAWLEEQGCNVELKSYPGGGHNAPPDLQRDLRALVSAYLQQNSFSTGG